MQLPMAVGERAPRLRPGAPAAASAGLPPEVRAFFTGPIPKTLTVRGVPGAGKTSFALANLTAFDGHRVFVTSSVPRSALLVQFPWLGRPETPTIEIVEFLRFRDPRSTGDLSIDQLREALQARASDLIDVAEILNLPPALHASLAAQEGRPSMVAIDSWEAWVENILGPSPLSVSVPTTRWELERSLLGEITRTGAHAILVAERVESSRFDYVSDGAISLSSSEFEGRQERWVSLSKLRGTRIENASYPFTLEGGRFRCLVPYVARGGRETVRPAPDPDPSADSLWPGSGAFARWFGRVPRQRCVVIEADSEVSERALWNLTLPLLLSALQGKGKVVLRPPGSLSSAEVWQTLSGEAPAEGVSARLRIIPPLPRAFPPGAPSEVYFGPEDRLRTYLSSQESEPRTPGSILWKEISTFLSAEREGTHGRDLVLAFPDTGVRNEPGDVEHVGDPLMNLPPDGELSTGGFASVLVLRSEDPEAARVRSRSSLHLMVRAVRGHLVLYGMRPWTPLLVPGVRGPGTPTEEPYDLIPVI